MSIFPRRGVSSAEIAALIDDRLAVAGAQPLDSDLTSIAALTTTSFGRGLLASSNSAALLASAAAQASDADLTAIAALTTTAYGRAVLSLVDQAALVALLPGYQPVDADLTSIAAISTTTYGRAVLALADQAALVALLPSYQAADADLTAIAAVTTVAFGRSVLALADAAAARTLLGAIGGIAESTDVRIPISLHDAYAVVGVWTQSRVAAGVYRWRRATGTGSADMLAVEVPTAAIRTTADKGLKVTGVAYKVAIVGEAVDALTFSGSYTVYPVNGNAIAAAVSLGAPTYDDGHDTVGERGAAGDHTVTVTFGSPVYLSDLLAMEFRWLVDDTTGGGAVVDVLGLQLICSTIPVTASA